MIITPNATWNYHPCTKESMYIKYKIKDPLSYLSYKDQKSRQPPLVIGTLIFVMVNNAGQIMVNLLTKKLRKT